MLKSLRRNTRDRLMCKDVARRRSGQKLFRSSATKAVGYRLFGSVTVVSPPSTKLALAIALLTLSSLATVFYIVEVPERIRAAGVLMPVGGMLDVVANRAGQVSAVFIRSGQLIDKDRLLFTINDGAHLHGESAPESNLRSLRKELELLDVAHERQQEMTADRMVALQDEMVMAIEQQDIADERLTSHLSEIEVLESRSLRRQQLVGDGLVSRDAFEAEQANLLRARTEHAEIRQRAVEHSRIIGTLSRSLEETEKQLALNEVQHAVSTERLNRNIKLGRHDALQEYRASEQGLVVQVLTQPGDAVRSGQVLAKLSRPKARLQAWLYLPTASARLLKAGQAVEISLDAYPREVYGTYTAVVASVSGIALLPGDIRAPLLLSGPVFEVKAELQSNDVDAPGLKWPLLPGISFSADIIQRRLRLYEWLANSLFGEAGNVQA